ncbi:uncharacterized protein LOC125039268 [Penaeus chinensis]|uniref:uncharacterized protein LOC125039268 n=1 Tax=Penaeus chinensis TaxID=139456 RepID=UPI001FB81A1C|nr:uncharacterized protein LOC125039268 [Penaeus chinensis]
MNVTQAPISVPPTSRVFLGALEKYNTIIESIRRQGAVDVFCQILENIYEDGTATIMFRTETDEISIKKGVRQCYTISPKLFTVCLEETFKKLNLDGNGFKIGEEHLTIKIYRRHCPL